VEIGSSADGFQSSHTIERRLREERSALRERLWRVEAALKVIEEHPELEPMLEVLGTVF
jgi:hypothetical protein